VTTNFSETSQYNCHETLVYGSRVDTRVQTDVSHEPRHIERGQAAHTGSTPVTTSIFVIWELGLLQRMIVLQPAKEFPLLLNQSFDFRRYPSLRRGLFPVDFQMKILYIFVVSRYVLYAPFNLS
jgi:hypothetical protein